MPILSSVRQLVDNDDGLMPERVLVREEWPHWWRTKVHHGICGYCRTRTRCQRWTMPRQYDNQSMVSNCELWGVLEIKSFEKSTKQFFKQTYTSQSSSTQLQVDLWFVNLVESTQAHQMQLRERNDCGTRIPCRNRVQRRLEVNSSNNKSIKYIKQTIIKIDLSTPISQFFSLIIENISVNLSSVLHINVCFFNGWHNEVLVRDHLNFQISNVFEKKQTLTKSLPIFSFSYNLYLMATASCTCSLFLYSTYGTT